MRATGTKLKYTIGKSPLMARGRSLHAIIRLHRNLNWSAIAREALRKRMKTKGMLRELTRAKSLTVRQALKIDRAVKKAIAQGMRLVFEQERDK